MTEIAARKGRITVDKAAAFLESLADLPIEIENPTRRQMFESVRALTGTYGLTAYDAAYLELAIRPKVPLASSDKALLKAALGAGVELVDVTG